MAIVEKETTTIVGTILLLQLPDKDGLPTQDSRVGWHLKQGGQGDLSENLQQVFTFVPMPDAQCPMLNDK